MSNVSRQGHERRCNRCVGRPLLTQCIHTKAGKEFMEQVCRLQGTISAPNIHQQKKNIQNMSAVIPGERLSNSVSQNDEVGLRQPTVTIFIDFLGI